jgi:hypothetical protein
VLPLHVACADLPVTMPPVGTLLIASSERGDGRQAMATGEVVVIQAGSQQGLAVGQSFVARRADGGPGALRRGWEGFAGIRTAGLLTITAVDRRFALAHIDRACDTVLVGDYLEQVAVAPLPVPLPAGPPDFSDRGSVLFGPDLRQVFGDGDLLAINRGSAHGVMPGTRVVIYRSLGPTLPMSELGEAVVLDTAQAASRAVLVRVRDFVSAGDVVVIRGAVQP